MQDLECDEIAVHDVREVCKLKKVLALGTASAKSLYVLLSINNRIGNSCRSCAMWVTCRESRWPWLELPAKFLQGLCASLEEALTKRKHISRIVCLSSEVMSILRPALNVKENYIPFSSTSVAVERR